MCRDVALCDWCMARVVREHVHQVKLAARAWAAQLPAGRAVPGWDTPDGRALALGNVVPLGVVDVRTGEALARAWLDEAETATRRRAERRAMRPAAERTTPAPARPASEVAAAWLLDRDGQPYAIPRGAVAFRVYQRRRGRLIEYVTPDGASLSLPLDLTGEAFARAVITPGDYQLVPVDTHGLCVARTPRSVTVF